MLTKLTLTIEKEIIKKAKHYAKQHHKSISRMVEEYLDTVSSETDTAVDNSKSPLTEKITGMFAEEYQGQDYDSLLEEAIKEHNMR